MTTSGIFTRKDNTQNSREKNTEETSEPETLPRLLFYTYEFGKVANSVFRVQISLNNYVLLRTCRDLFQFRRDIELVLTIPASRTWSRPRPDQLRGRLFPPTSCRSLPRCLLRLSRREWSRKCYRFFFHPFLLQTPLYCKMKKYIYQLRISYC